MYGSSKFDEIIERYRVGKFPHAYIFNSNNLEKLKKDLNILIKNILCEESFNLECNSECNICRLFNNNSLPNYIDVYPEGLQIKKEQVEYIMDKFNKKPVYGKYNIYVINNCDYLNAKSSNMLLKFIEEPEDNILGFFTTDNIEKVLPTIKSRCEVVNIFYQIDDEDEVQYMDNITNFINYIKSNNNIYLIYDVLFADIDYSRKDFCNMLKTMINQFDKNINENNVVLLSDFDIKKTIKAMDLIKNTLSKLESNVNIEVAMILFAGELRKIYE